MMIHASSEFNKPYDDRSQGEVRGCIANCRQRKIQSSSPCQIRRINRQTGADRKCSSRGTSKPGRQHKRRELLSPTVKGRFPQCKRWPAKGCSDLGEGVRLRLFFLPPPTLSLFAFTCWFDTRARSWFVLICPYCSYSYSEFRTIQHQIDWVVLELFNFLLFSKSSLLHVFLSPGHSPVSHPVMFPLIFGYFHYWIMNRLWPFSIPRRAESTRLSLI